MRRERQPCVYILASGFNRTLYTGVTSDLLKRLYEHREGTTEGFVAEFAVYRLVYGEIHATMPLAIAREKQLKKWRRDWKKNLIELDNPQWDDLAIELGFEPMP